MLTLEISLLGRLHPMLVHLPIGLLIGMFMLETWNRISKKEIDYTYMAYLGAITAILSAIMGAVLKSSEEYSGTLVDQHQWAGYITAGLSLITAVLYGYRDRLPAKLPFAGLLLSCVGITVAGHLGASLTHGEDYLSAALPWNQVESVDHEDLQAFQAFAAGDSFPQDQLDRLNLQVRAIFAHNCYQCHSTAKRKGGLALDHQEGVFAGGENGPIFTAGHAAESEMLRRLTLPRPHDDAMPPKGKSLQPPEIELIKLWIDQGAHWADESLKVFREAELALTKPATPEGPAELSNPIDQFVNVYFEEQGISWPQTIDDRQFIRRAYLDITGLMPEPGVIQSFVADPASNKRTVLIQELLADKENYALHWLSFWNDLLRNDYTGTGYITGGRKQITEWLYRSILEEKPYNQMVSELIDPSPESEGFIKGIQWRGTVNASQRTELQAAQNISQSLLGVNLKCASCHNSFINNLTLDQAYGFANIFAREPLEIYRCDKPTGRIAQTSFLYPELGEVVSDSLKDRLKELAGIVVKPENGRLYRTIVNRFWDRLLGRGIVAPVDEMDNIPWSQDLLDWLAMDFIENDYDFRQLLLRIMTSKAYQLPAVPYPSPEYLQSEEFVFQGPAIRRLTAEQFVDALSQTVTPFYQSVAFDPAGRSMEANWIWHEEIELDRRVLPKPGTRLFRKTFSVDQSPSLTKANVLITADHAFTLFINGKKLTSGKDWRQVQKMEIPVDLLKPENIIAVKGYNDGLIPNPAGLLFALQLAYADSTFQYVYSDRSWKTTADTSANNWQDRFFDDTNWKNAWQAGSFQKSYWGTLLDFDFKKDSLAYSFARASLVKQDDFMKTLGRPVRENVVTQRDEEATLLQSLMLTNSAFFHEKIRRGASDWLTQYDHDRLIEKLYLQVLGREPTAKEKRVLLRQLKAADKQQALEDIMWSLVLLPEFWLI